MISFLNVQNVDQYVSYMEKDETWGDQISLVAISETFGVRIKIFSIINDKIYITQMIPRTIKTHEQILLANWGLRNFAPIYCTHYRFIFFFLETKENFKENYSSLIFFSL